MKTNTTNIQTSEVLNSMTRDELRALATHLNVPRGKSKNNTVANVASALANGHARFKSIVTISTNPPDGSEYGGKVLFVKKFRSYKPDKVIATLPPIVVPAD